MAELYGYTGKILRVNLTTGGISEFSSEKYLPKYLGSKGLLARLYWDEISPEVKPFDPENKLIFASGPVNGTGAVGSAKGSVGGKSPVWSPVSSFSYANTASSFPNELKRAGYDAVIIEGKAVSPVYVWINNGNVEIRDARDLWGKTTRNTRALLWKKLGEHVKVACIGPAGENKVVQAVITVACNAVYGRGGFGAVMGSKNLKAIAAFGTGRIKVADPKKLMEVNLDRTYGKWLAPGVKRIVNGKEVVGPEVNEIDHFSLAGNIRVDTQLKQWARLGTAAIGVGGCEACNNYCRMRRTFYSGQNLPNSSYTCASGIGWTATIQNEKAKKGIIEMMDGYEAIEYANLVDDLGLNMNNMSTISTYMGFKGKLCDEGEELEGTLMGGDWLYNCYLWGIFTEQNTGLPWSKIGTSEFSQALIRKIAYREGFGDVIAQGWRYAAKYVVEHEEFGSNRQMALTLYQRIDSKAGNMGCIENGHGHYVPNSGRSLFTAVSDRTGSEPEYMFSGMTKYLPSTTPEALQVAHKWWGEGCEKAYDHYCWDPEVAHTVIVHERNCNMMDSAHFCSFVASSLPTSYRDWQDALTRTPNGLPEYLTAIFGKEVTWEELENTADMITNLVRAILVRDGYTTTKDDFWGNDVDTFWEYTFQRKDSKGVDLTNKEGFLRLRESYYQERGWINGVPTRATLEKYGLKDVADGLASKGLLPT